MQNVTKAWHWRFLFPMAALALGTGCDVENVPVYGDAEASQSFSTTRGVSVHNEHEGDEDSQCYRERIVQAPRGNPKKGNRKVPEYFLTGAWADIVDFDTLEMELNNQDIDWSVETETGKVVFSNPGKSRAVIDFFCCLKAGDAEDNTENDSDTSNGTDTDVPSDDSLDEGGLIDIEV